MSTVVTDLRPDRSTYIGGSDIAAILGVSPWRTRLDCYLSKIEPLEIAAEEESDENRQIVLKRGKRLEPYVLSMLAEQEGLNILYQNRRHQHPEFAFMMAEIDAETDDTRNVEIKTANWFKRGDWGEPGTDEIPVYYVAQVQWGLGVSGRSEAICGVLLGVDDFRVYHVRRDDEIIDVMTNEAVAFWQQVQDMTPPPAATMSDIKRLFERDDGMAVEADQGLANLVNEYRAVKQDLRVYEANAEALKEAIALRMGPASILTYCGDKIASYKAQTRHGFDQAGFKKDHPDLFDAYSKEMVFRVMR